MNIKFLKKTHIETGPLFHFFQLKNKYKKMIVWFLVARYKYLYCHSCKISVFLRKTVYGK